MKTLHVAAAVLNQTPLDWDGNQRRIVATIRAARERGAAVLCLPELCISGYGCEDAFHAPGTLAQADRVLREILPETKGIVVAIGLPVFHHKGLFDTVALLVDGAPVGAVAKRFLAGDGIHYEPRWFKPWQAGVRTTLELAGREVPFGDLLFDVGGIRIGFEICEDAWVADRPGALLSKSGVDLILNPSASHFSFGKLDIRARFVAEGSRAFGVAYVYANLLGNEAGRAIYDGDALIAAGGRIIAEGPRLTFHEWGITSAVIDVERERMAQARTASFHPDLDGPAAGVVELKHAWNQNALPTAPAVADAWQASPRIKEEEFSRALALSLFDYMRKSRSHGFVVSLSGGADSAAVAVLIALMVRRGLDDLGAAALRERLAYVPNLPASDDAKAWVARLLTTAYQPSANSSDVTRDAARAVAAAIGARHLEIDVEPFAQAYRTAVETALGRTLDWQRDDLALQNIQARVRAPSVWLIANVHNALLVATSNRSEAAVGYATMDGDTCGGLSPIAGIDKAFLRRWLEWMRVEGPLGIGPLPELIAITAQRSTPELRPAAAKQVSEEDLMPFPVLTAIELLAIRDKRPPVDVFQMARAQFPEHPAEQVRSWVERFFTLWCRNQWKRERYAPSFHLDDDNLDPKTWCRFPILSGGYARELEELRALKV